MDIRECKAKLLATETKLARDPENQELLNLKADLEAYIELSCGLEDESDDITNVHDQPGGNSKDSTRDDSQSRASGSQTTESHETKSDSNNLVDKNSSSTSSNSKRALSGAELLAKKKEKNRKKKAKLRERIKAQLDIAESEKQSWQSFANKKGLKGLTKKSIFASPCSVTGKVGVGTNGIADAPSAAGATAVAYTKRKY